MRSDSHCIGVERPRNVVPEDVDLAVVGQQLADEAVGVVDKAPAGGFVRLADGAVGMVPVHERVVEANAQAFGAGGFNEFADQIAAGPLLHGVVVGELGVPVAEALVVLGGHHHVLLAGALGQARPVARGVGLGMEVLGQDLVLRNGNALVLLGPLVLADDAVEPPVDEHAELGLVPPRHARVARGGLLQVGGRGRGLRGGWRAGGLRQCQMRAGAWRRPTPLRPPRQTASRTTVSSFRSNPSLSPSPISFFSVRLSLWVPPVSILRPGKAAHRRDFR